MFKLLDEMTQAPQARLLHPLDIIKYFGENRHEKITNHDLVRHFRPFLVIPEVADDNKRILKEVTGQIGVVKKMKGNKMIELQPKFKILDVDAIWRHVEKEHYSTIEDDQVVPENTEELTDKLEVPRSRAPIYDPSSLKEEENFLRPRPKMGNVPQITIEDSEEHTEISRTSAENAEEDDVFPEEPPETPVRKYMREKTRTSVKDLTKNFDQIASESEVKLTDHASRFEVARTHYNRKRSSLQSFSSEDSNKNQIKPLTPESRSWIIAASKNDQHTMLKLLKNDGELVDTRDPGTGYTALHWAAKHGNPVMLKTLLGVHQCDPNQRTRGGYTPLMLAAMSKKEVAFKMLVETYEADVDLRDYSGRKAHDYYDTRVLSTVLDDDDDVMDRLDAPDGGRRKKLAKKVERSSTFVRDFIRESMRPIKKDNGEE